MPSDRNAPTVTDAEALVMQLLWQKAPLAAEDIAAALGPTQGWQPTTVKTLLNRLLNKGAVSAQRDGRRYLYAPVLQQQDWRAQQSISLLDRLFAGRLAPLVAEFSAQRRLEPADLAALKALLKDYESD